MKPEAEPVPSDVREAALQTVREAKFPMVASIDGDQPRVRPVSPLRVDGFTVYFASLRSSHKTAEIDANTNVELCYLAGGHDQVRITGVAERITDRPTLEDLWDGSPLLRSYLGSLDNPELIIYRVTPLRVRFMREWALEYHDVPLA